MAELARWSLKVSRDTDVALRTLPATRGGRKGDLSRFVEEVVNREVLRQTVNDIRARNGDLNENKVSLWSTMSLARLAQPSGLTRGVKPCG